MSVDVRGASAGFSNRERLLRQQRALSVSGVALTGRGSRSRRHVSRARDERRLLGTPRMTACTGPSVEGRLTPASESGTGRRTSSPPTAWIFLPSTPRSLRSTAVARASGGRVSVRRPLAPGRRTLQRRAYLFKPEPASSTTEYARE